MKKFAIIGATRGLGRAVFEALAASGQSGLLVARNATELEKMAALNEGWSYIKADMTKPEARGEIMQAISSMDLVSVIYCSGGGPHGDFYTKNWKDHRWAIELNFAAPAELLHFLGSKNKTAQHQFVYVGSAIAEGTDETEGASYVASKRAMVGLLGSLRGRDPLLDLRLFSPGYMNTDLLPKGAGPRKTGNKILDPKVVAKELISWASAETDEWHRVLLPE